jgi:hypothetical protein
VLWSGLKNRLPSRLSGMLVKRGGIKSGRPDLFVLHRANGTMTGFCGVEIETRRCAQSAGSSRTQSTRFPRLCRCRIGGAPVADRYRGGEKEIRCRKKPERAEHCALTRNIHDRKQGRRRRGTPGSADKTAARRKYQSAVPATETDKWKSERPHGARCLEKKQFLVFEKQLPMAGRARAGRRDVNGRSLVGLLANCGPPRSTAPFCKPEWSRRMVSGPVTALS